MTLEFTTKHPMVSDLFIHAAYSVSPEMFGRDPNIDGVINLEQNLITGSDDGAIYTNPEKHYGHWHADGGSQFAMSLIFSAQRANAAYSGESIQASALQCLICIKF